MTLVSNSLLRVKKMAEKNQIQGTIQNYSTIGVWKTSLFLLKNINLIASWLIDKCMLKSLNIFWQGNISNPQKNHKALLKQYLFHACPPLFLVESYCFRNGSLVELWTLSQIYCITQRMLGIKLHGEIFLFVEWWFYFGNCCF